MNQIISLSNGRLEKYGNYDFFLQKAEKILEEVKTFFRSFLFRTLKAEATSQ